MHLWKWPKISPPITSVGKNVEQQKLTGCKLNSYTEREFFRFLWNQNHPCHFPSNLKSCAYTTYAWIIVTTPQTCKQETHPSVNGWVNKLWFIQTTKELYLRIRMIHWATHRHGRWKHMFYQREIIFKMGNIVSFWLYDILGSSNTEDSEKINDCQVRGSQGVTEDI